LDRVDSGVAIGKGEVEIDFLTNGVASEVGEELVETSGRVVFGNSGEILSEELGALGFVGVVPFGLVFIKIVAIDFPVVDVVVALEAGSLSGTGGSEGVGMVANRVGTVDNGEFAGIFFDKFGDEVDMSSTGGTLEVGIFNNNDRSVKRAFDMFGDIARGRRSGDDGVDVVIAFGAARDTKNNKGNKSGEAERNKSDF